MTLRKPSRSLGCSVTPSAEDPLHVDLRLGMEPRGLMLGKRFQHVRKVEQLMLLLFRKK